ncbi:hypothetical protein [Nocardioides sp. KR10-350]|uniref:hypothetical protein n=1 Tax=Nocardioides cheoyonin TaxID=3156615 RepID=UPI0032B51926
MNPEDQELRDALERRAEGAGLTPSSLAEVQRRARRIRRRRTALVATGAAAAIAVIAGVGVAVSPGLDHDGAPQPSTNTPAPLRTLAPSASASASPTAPPPSTATDPSASSSAPSLETFTVDLDDVTEGMGPELRIPYWFDGRLVDGNGGHAVPVQDRPQSPVLVNGTWHGMTTSPNDGTVRWNTYAADGSVADYQQAGSASVAVTPDGGTYAVVLDDGGIGKRLRVGGTGGSSWEVALGAGDGWEVAGILPDGNVVVGDPQGRAVVVHKGGKQDVLPGTTPQAVSPATGDIVVRTRDLADQQRSCWALVDESGKRTSGETCDYVPLGFSADGSELYAMDSGADNVSEGVSRIHLLDPRTLHPVASFSAAKGTALYVEDAAWMGDQLVVPVRGPAGGTLSWGLAFVSKSGVTIQHQATRPARGSHEPPYSFGAGPLDVG